jgi:RNAse (barnase) inhibitor barstar
VEKVELRGDRISSREELLDALGDALGFFDQYGRNLDALWDCLEDPDLRRVKGPAEIHWVDWRRYQQDDPEGFDKVIAQFEETTAPLNLRLAE